MTRTVVALTTAVAVLASTSYVTAQMQPGAPSPTAQAPAPPQQPAPPRHQMLGQHHMGGMHGGMGMIGQQEMIMCPVMGGMMGSGGMGMTGRMPGDMRAMGMAMPSDPKMLAWMLKLRGEMMKAMGEVMMKHGQAIEQEK